MSVAKLIDYKLDTFLVSGEADEALMRRDLAYFAERVLNAAFKDTASSSPAPPFRN